MMPDEDEMTPVLVASVLCHSEVSEAQDPASDIAVPVFIVPVELLPCETVNITPQLTVID
jgi:hypothetical protein